MDIPRLLAFYDQEMRQELVNYNARRETGPYYVRNITQDDGYCQIEYAYLTRENVDERVAEQVAYFEKLGKDFSWNVYLHDTPFDLRERLEARGFLVEEEEPILILDVEEAPPILEEPVHHDIRRLEQVEQLLDVVAVEEQVYKGDFSWLNRRLSRVMNDHPEALSVYVGYVDSKPICAAWMFYQPEGHFASLYGGSTLEAYRLRGYYSALLAVRLQEARQHGAQYLMVNAGPMSLPILERLGFQVLTKLNPCVWHIKK